MASVEWLWPAAAAGGPLAEDEVRVWSVDLDDAAPLEASMAVLSADERERAARFATDELRRRFVTGRSTLRQVLGGCLGCDAASLVFRYGIKGKPELDGPHRGRLQFNLSHTGGVGLIAVTRRCAVGVDVEWLGRRAEAQQVAKRFFTADETARLDAMPETDRPAAFISLWTRKEAWLKATGGGIGETLNRVEVSFQPGEPVQVLRVADDPAGAAGWMLAELVPATGFTGALAARARGLNVSCGHWVKERARFQC